MAGYTRFAAKLVLGTAVLTSVGAGGYYAATSLDLRPAVGSAPNELEEGSQAAAANASGELDAVESAWAQPLPATPAVDASTRADDQFSPSARSANVTIASVENASAAMPDDRYGIYPGMQAAVNGPPVGATAETALPADAANNTEQATLISQPIESIEAPAPNPQPADSNDLAPLPVPVRDRERSSDIRPDETSTIARGQEPSDGAEASSLKAINIADESDSLSASSRVPSTAEPQAPNLSTNESPLTTAAERAFHDDPAVAPADRYGLPPGSSNTPTPAAADPATVNPFEQKSAIAAAPAGTQDTIETLPAFSSEEAISSDSAQSAAAAPSHSLPGRSTTAGRTAGTGISSAADHFRSAAPASSFDTLKNPVSNDPAGSATGRIASSSVAGATGINGTGRPGERALEGPQSSNLVIQKLAPSEIQVNKPAKFVVQIRNAGSQAAENVEVRDEVPQGTRLISTTPSAEAVGNQLVWQIGKLSTGEERNLEIELMPLTEGEIGSVATIAYSAQASVKTRCTMPQLAIRMKAPEKVLIGQEQRVKIELTNPGTGDATNIMLFENVPQNLKHAAGPSLEFEIGTLRPGETRQLELVLLAEKPGKVVNTLIARADGNLQVQQQAEFEVIAPALAVELNGPERRYLERPATYEVSIANPGTAPAYDVQIVTKLPKGMRFVRANNMGEYDAGSHAVYWSLAELPEGESGTVEVVAMPIETGPQLLEVETRSAQGLADQARQQVTIEGLAAIMFELRDLEDPIEEGGETGYEIRVVNEGTKAATNVQITVGFSPGMQVVSAEGETRHEAQGSSLVFEPITELAPKADSLFRVRARGVSAGDQRVKVQVMTDDLREPILREESTRVFGDE